MAKILAWADGYHERTGRWPKYDSGLLEGTGGETWLIIDRAFHEKRRGLPGGFSLASFLNHYRQVPNRLYQPQLSVETVLKWADAHYRRTGRWPALTSGPIGGTEGEKWHLVNDALRAGRRGLPAGLTLRRLLIRHGRGIKSGS